jgi:hypothetical protein
MPGWFRGSLKGLGGLAALAIGLQAYCLLPAGFVVPPLAAPEGTGQLILVFHGSGGRDEPVLRALEVALRERATAGGAPLVMRYDWSPHSDARLRTWPNGRRVGEMLGAELAGFRHLQSVHLIAHSAGAYVLEPLCEAYRAARAEGAVPAARIRMTYLDPIGFRGPLDPGWGARHYGQCADEAEAFINTDDPAPATAATLRYARTTDVTGDPGRTQFTGGGHRWPVQYYINRLAVPGGAD